MFRFYLEAASHVFDLDPDSGVIRVKDEIKLDREVTPVITLKVVNLGSCKYEAN